MMINGDYFKQFILKYVDEPLTEDDGQAAAVVAAMLTRWRRSAIKVHLLMVACVNYKILHKLSCNGKAQLFINIFDRPEGMTKISL